MQRLGQHDEPPAWRPCDSGIQHGPPCVRFLSAQSAQQYIERCSILLYILTGKGNTVGVRLCVSSNIMGLASNSEHTQ